MLKLQTCSMLASSLLRLPSMFLLLFLFLSYIASPRGWRCCGAAGDTATMLKLLPFCFELLLLLLQQLQHWPQPNCRESRAKHSQAALENYNNKKCCLFLCGSEFSRRILFCCSAKNRTKRYWDGNCDCDGNDNGDWVVRTNASYRAAQSRAEHKPGKNIGARCFQIASTELQLSSAQRHGEFAEVICAKAELRVGLALLVVAIAVSVAVVCACLPPPTGEEWAS